MCWRRKDIVFSAGTNENDLSTKIVQTKNRNE